MAVVVILSVPVLVCLHVSNSYLVGVCDAVAEMRPVATLHLMPHTSCLTPLHIPRCFYRRSMINLLLSFASHASAVVAL